MRVDEGSGRARAITIPGVTSGGFSLPLLGVIAAGKTIEAVEQDERLEMKDLFGQSNLYVLKVRGTSMIDSQIADGDFVVIKKQETADNGEKVVAMVDKAMTLKKFYRRGEMVELRPANSEMASLVYPAQDVKIRGVVVSLLRRFR